uniref:MFS domain-containing protein n=1 Tax=Macrostomum lignano TaxID=282301 RepID=A0A1I8HWK8_9PLAT
AADAMEMLLLAILGPTLRCEWHLSHAQVAAMTTFVFIGMLLGASIWGAAADKVGRRTVLLVSTALIAYFGLLCSAAPSYAWVVTLRCFVGFNIGGGAQSYTLLTEYLPHRTRVAAIVSNLLSWCAGGIFLVLTAWVIVPTLGWRWLTALAAAPLALVLPLMLLFLPESLRYLLASGREVEAAKVMELMAKENGGHVSQLFHSSIRRVTLTLFPIWFTIAFTYYGIILLSSDVTSFKQRCPSDNSPTRDSSIVDTSCCRNLNSQDYKSILLASTGELVILPFNLILLDRIGRRPTAALLFIAASIFVGLVSACVPAWTTTAFLFLTRGCAAALFNWCYLYTAEVYPTSIRSLGIGLHSAVARVGSMLTPLVAQVLLPQVSVSLAFSTYIGLNLACCCLAISLPVETLGRAMQQSIIVDDSSTSAAASGVNEKKD